jgi:hypothetical protein
MIVMFEVILAFGTTLSVFDVKRYSQ